MRGWFSKKEGESEKGRNTTERERELPFGEAPKKKKRSKAALEAIKMTALFPIDKLSVSSSMAAANGVVYELRMLAKTSSDR